jgi:hypothetical protein
MSELPVEGIGLDMIQGPKPEPRIMRYELTDFEWTATVVPSEQTAGHSPC